MGLPFSGLLDLRQGRSGSVRSFERELTPGPDDPVVSSRLVFRHHLRNGVLLAGESVPAQGGGRTVQTIAEICGMSPKAWMALPPFEERVAVAPDKILRLHPARGGTPEMRLISLFCPIGKGQRGLIVSPPKAGKTTLLQHLAEAVHAHNPEVVLLVLLVDERPEEVTDMRRTVKGRVFASSSDSDRGRHVRLGVLVLDYARRLVETGRDVVILLDSLTRLGRAFNLHQPGSGRTLSGGVDARALEIPKRIFGAARNLEGGGSLTILATVLVQTGSRMDELIFQEFKGTGNMELVLSRPLADERLFPALHLHASGTRREELLFGAGGHRQQILRRSIARLSPKEALLAVQALLRTHPSNEELLAGFQ
ncbi:MAG: transcription termination factor Rho [Bacteroidota bacterium]